MENFKIPKSARVEVLTANIPDELRDTSQWICWKYEDRDGKLSKVPYDAKSGELAAVNKPGTWANFQTAFDFYENQHDINGIGFVLTENDEFTGMDLDHCINDGNIDPQAQDIIKLLDSYTETTPSGEGIRIICMGKLPEGKRRRGNIEAYDNGRYLTITGQRLPSACDYIAVRRQELKTFHTKYLADSEKKSETRPKSKTNSLEDDEIIRHAGNAANGDKFHRLMSGDTSGYSSQSEADAALCMMLAFWCGKDAEQIDRIFKTSGLYRPKWEELHGRATYGQITIENAIIRGADSYQNAKKGADTTGNTPLNSQSDKNIFKINEWPVPVPLPDSLPPVKTLIPEMLPEPFRPWIMDIAERMQCPVDYVAAAAIVVAGSLIGSACCIYPKEKDDWHEFPNLWGAIIGRPSLLKTPAMTEATKPLRQLAAEASNAYQDNLVKYDQEKIIHKAKRDVLDGDLKKAIKTGGDLQALINGIGELTVPVEKRFMTQDGTTEKIGEILLGNPRGILAYRDEIVGLLHSLDKQGREGDRAFYLEAWNAKGGFSYDRIGRGTLHIEMLILSVFGAITPGALSEYVSGAIKEGCSDDGLMQRFQVAVYPDPSPEWENVDRHPDLEAKNRAYEIFKILSEDEIYSNLKGDPPGLRFDAEAQAIFKEWRAELETRLRKGDLASVMESHVAKYRKLVPCLALIFHLIEVADGTAEGDVSARSFIKAAAWGEYLESHAVRIYDAAISFGMQAAKELLRHIQTGEIKDGATPRDIYQHHWTKLTSPEEVMPALEILQEYDWIRLIKIETGGRPSQIIRVTPKGKKL